MLLRAFERETPRFIWWWLVFTGVPPVLCASWRSGLVGLMALLLLLILLWVGDGLPRH